MVGPNLEKSITLKNINEDLGSKPAPPERLPGHEEITDGVNRIEEGNELNVGSDGLEGPALRSFLKNKYEGIYTQLFSQAEKSFNALKFFLDKGHNYDPNFIIKMKIELDSELSSDGTSIPFSIGSENFQKMPPYERLVDDFLKQIALTVELLPNKDGEFIAKQEKNSMADPKIDLSFLLYLPGNAQGGRNAYTYGEGFLKDVVENDKKNTREDTVASL